METNPEMVHLIQDTVKATLAELGLGNTKSKNQKSAYQKMEQLLFGYNSFKKVIADKQQEVEDIKKHGVPSRSPSVGEYTVHGGLPCGIVLPEESVESTVQHMWASVQVTVRVVAMIDKAMASISKDPFYSVLEMRYFEGRTLEDIAATYGCTHSTISRNRSRLVKELALKIFPDQVVSEYMN